MGLAVAALSLVIPAAAQAFSFPLKGWWPMNEGQGQTVRDWSGNGGHGYLGTSPGADAADPEWVDGVLYGSALRFWGDRVVSIPASSALRPQQLTVSAWLRYQPDTMGWPVPGVFKYPISMGGEGCGASSYGMVTNPDDGLAFFIAGQGGTGYESPAAPRSIWDGKWHHVAGTFDGSRVRLYVDGKQQGNGTPVPAGTKIDYSFANRSGVIGGYAGTCDQLLSFRGDIDGVQIWSTPVPVDTVWKLLRSLFNGR
jgi:hypothetical protein